ncbi:glycosyltransferase family 4 protein [Enterobacter sp. E76]|nr:glycosyltransferase family 4 protein [Enterobacter sp. E76]
MNILVLCTYPVLEPRHGGQLRANNIIEGYRAEGHQVQVCGVLGSASYPAEEGFCKYPGDIELNKIVPNNFLFEDYAISRLFSEVDSFYNELEKKIKVTPDLIHVEQPWLFPFVKRYITQKNKAIPVIYGSQNIEFMLKEQICKSYDILHQSETLIKAVSEIEHSIIRFASACICVSETDLQWVEKQGAAKTILAPNGVSKRVAKQADVIEVMKVTKGKKFAIYCASAHPPNMQGFFDMFSGGFGSLKPDENLILIGGVGYAIAGDQRVHQSAKLAEKVIIAGMVTEELLAAYLELAHCIVLPLTQGGGTNLKTAEAIWSGKYVVATSIAMRGFEAYKGQKGIYVCDQPDTFKQTLRKTMSLEKNTLSAEEIKFREKVLWESCLSKINGLAEFLIRQAI